ncbi:hypothetical protein Tco_0392187 [Tanacetum coccineum]
MFDESLNPPTYVDLQAPEVIAPILKAVAPIPMVEKSKLDEDKEGKVVDPSHYRGMIEAPSFILQPLDLTYNLLYACVPGTVHRGLWYPKDSSFALTAFADTDHAGCQDTR